MPSTETTATTEIVRISVPIPRMDLFEKAARRHNTTPDEVVRKSNTLATLLFVPDLEFFIKNGLNSPMRRIEALTEVNDPNSVTIEQLLEEFGIADLDVPINHQTDANWVMEKVAHDGIILERSRDQIQRQAALEVQEASQRIIDKYGPNLKPEYLDRLDGLENGVIVVKNLDPVITDLSLFADNSLDSKINIALLKLCKRMGIKGPSHYIHGLVCSPYAAVLLDEALFRRSTSSQSRKHTTTHEVMHVIGDNLFPQMINEVGADIYAERATGEKSDSRNRLGGNFGVVFDIYHWIEQQAGEELVFDAYISPSVARHTLDQKGNLLELRLEDHPLHEHMKQKMGSAQNGKFNWDQLITLISQKRIPQAAKFIKKF